MRIDLIDDMCYSHSIDSHDLDLIGRWFAEKSKLIMSADIRINHPARIDIWPSTPEESALIPQYHRNIKFTQDDILALASHLTEISAELGERE